MLVDLCLSSKYQHSSVQTAGKSERARLSTDGARDRLFAAGQNEKFREGQDS